MAQLTPHLEMIMNLEARHDELLRRLDDLDRRVEEALKAWQVSRTESEPRESQPA